MRARQRTMLAIVLWLAAIALAAMFDRPVATWMRDFGVEQFMNSHKALAHVFKFAGVFYCTAIVAIVVACTHSLRWKAGGFLLLAVAVSGLNGLSKWIVGRTRPFKLDPTDLAAPFTLTPFRGGFGGMFNSKNLCFPSGHAALAFATAAAVAIFWPRAPWRWGGFAVAGIVAIERVAENAHWLSDVVAAAALGIGGVYLIHWMITRLMPQTEPAAQPTQVQPLS